MADFWVRKLGGSSKAAAVDLSTAMSVAAFNSATFDENDRIFFSGIDGDLTTGVIPASGGISLLADPDYGCTVHGNDTIETCIDIVSKNSIEIDGIKVTHPTTDGVQIRGTSSGVVVKNVESSYSGNQAFQMEGSASATFFEIIGRNCVDDGFSLHGATNATIYGGVFTDNAQGINTISDSYIETYDCIVSGCTGESLYTADASAEGKVPIAKHYNCIVTGGLKLVRVSYNGDVSLVNCKFIKGACVDHLVDVESTGKIIIISCVFDSSIVNKFAVALRAGSACNGIYNTHFKSGLGKGIYTNINTDIANCIFTGLATAVHQVSGIVGVRNCCLRGNGVNTVGSVVVSGTVAQDPLLTADYHLRTDSPLLGAGTKIPGVNTDIEGNPLFPPYNIGSYGIEAGALGVAPVVNDGPPRNNITRLTGESTVINPTDTYEFADTNAWRVVTGWTAGTGNDFFDENGVPIPFPGQKLIDAGLGDKLFCGTEQISGYSEEQTGATLARIKEITGVA